jgi:hypothetical protein
MHNGVWFEGKWTQLEDIMLSEASQNQKDVCALIGWWSWKTKQE